MKVQITQLIVIIFLAVVPMQELRADITSRALADSLNTYAGFPTCVPRVRVKNLRVNQGNIAVYTNKTLSCLALSEEELTNLRTKISRWVNGNNNGKVSIYSDGYELSELITECQSEHRHHGGSASLDGKTIALWPSHGMYYNSKQHIWRWQRATMWTIVEDLLSYELTHHWLIPMLENAGAYVLEPRAREGYYYQTKDSIWLWVGNQEIDPDVKVRYMGNEMGQIRRGGETSGVPQWMEGARYWLEYCGYPDSIWNPNIDNDYKDDLQCRGLWVNYLTGGSKQNPKQAGLGIPVDMCLALHTDGYSAETDSDYIGTLVIYTDQDQHGNKTFANGKSRMMINRTLADYIQTQIVDDMRQLVTPEWVRRELNNATYCESRYPVIPSALVEVFSHKNYADIQKCLDPNVQQLCCRAIYKGIGRWIQGEDFVVQPLPVYRLKCRIEGAPQEPCCQLTWAPTIDPLEPSARPTHYIVYTRKDSLDWDEGIVVEDTTYTFPMHAGIKYDIRVNAVNQGGKSLNGDIISTYLSTSSGNRPVLIVNAFDQVRGPEWFTDSTYAGIKTGSYPVPDGVSRVYMGDQFVYEKKLDWIDDDNCGWGMCYQDYAGQPIVGNTRDYPAQRGWTLAQGDTTYISYSYPEQWGEDSTLYSMTEIYFGQQRNGLYSSNIRHLIDNQINKGCDVHIIGKYLGSGMADSNEQKWAERTLNYKLRAPNATHQNRKENAPDALEPLGNKNHIIARYPDTRLVRAFSCKHGSANIIITCQ